MVGGEADKHLIWTEKSRKILGEYGIFTVYGAERTAIENLSGRFVLVESPDWVTVVPVLATAEESFLMVRQFRHGSASITVEFPAGVVHPGEPPEQAARRELLEETGYDPGSLLHIGTVNPNPAFMTNSVHTYVALDLVKVQHPTLDEHELLDVETVSAQQVYKEMGRGIFGHGIMVIALSWYLRWKKEKEKEEEKNDGG